MEQIRAAYQDCDSGADSDSDANLDADSDDEEEIIAPGGERLTFTTYDKCLASLNSYRGDIVGTERGLLVLDGGTIVIVPIYYQGNVLFPKAILSLSVTQDYFKAVIDRALSQVDAPRYIIGVIRDYYDSSADSVIFTNTGTTAEIIEFSRALNGSLNVEIHGLQRFRVKRHWIDEEGTPCGEVQIIQEDRPLRTPGEAFGDRAPLMKLHIHDLASPSKTSHSKLPVCEDGGNISDDSFENGLSDDSFENGLSAEEMRMHQSHRVSRAFLPYWVYRMYDSYSLAERLAEKWRYVIGLPSVDVLAKKPDLLSLYIASWIPVKESIRQELLEIDGISYRLQREIELLEEMERLMGREPQTGEGDQKFSSC